MELAKALDELESARKAALDAAAAAGKYAFAVGWTPGDKSSALSTRRAGSSRNQWSRKSRSLRRKPNQAGAPLHDVQMVLGHKNISTTSPYLNSTPEGQRESFQKLASHRLSKNLRIV